MWPHLYLILYILVSQEKLSHTDNELPGEQRQEERSGSGDVGSNPSPGPSQLCDLGEITLPLHLRSWPENEEFGVML